MTLARVLKGLVAEHMQGDIEIVEVDVDLQVNKELVAEYQIEKVPVLALSPEVKLVGVKSLYNINKWLSENGN
jgi:hypothetical protein